MRNKYPDKHLLVIMDNLHAHKNDLIMKIMQYSENMSILYTPSTSPQFSPIENMFAKVKK